MDNRIGWQTRAAGKIILRCSRCQGKTLSFSYYNKTIIQIGVIYQVLRLYNRVKIEQKGSVFCPRLWLFFSPFFFPLIKEGRRKREWITKVVVKNNAFLLDLAWNGKETCDLAASSYTGWSKKKFMMWSRGKMLEKF